MKRIIWQRFARQETKASKGHAVLLGESSHVCAPYTGAGDSPVLGPARMLATEDLRTLSRKGQSLSLCFAPQNIYADIGDFSSVSAEATLGHIRAAVDKIRLFKDDYRVVYAKLNDIDAVRGSYSYLVIPVIELDTIIEQVDPDNAIVDMVCPIEAALAAAMGSLGREMSVLVYEDPRFIRIIAAKDGIIYHLTTINSAESFDPLLDTVSGVHESISLLKNSYRQDVAKVYTLGKGAINQESLSELALDTEPFPLCTGDNPDLTYPILLGTILQTRYDFTPDKLRAVKRLSTYARVSTAVSLAMACMALVLFVIAGINYMALSGIRKELKNASYRNTEMLKLIEQDYAQLSRDLNLTDFNSIMQSYQQFQREPRLPVIVDAVSRRTPALVFLTKIELRRPAASEGDPSARVEPPEGGVENRTAQVDYFHLEIHGIINSVYPRSKEIFSTLVSNIQGVYPVESAAFSHKQDQAVFSLKCKVRL